MGASISTAGRAGKPPLEASYALCLDVTRRRARNFHFAFRLLPAERYRGICALYAFARLADDFSDDGADPAQALAHARAWHAHLDRALAGDASAHPILPAVAATLERFQIPPSYLHDLIAGTEMDARVTRFSTWEETRRYCYLVASVVGLMTVHVLGIPANAPAQRACGTGGLDVSSPSNVPPVSPVDLPTPMRRARALALAEETGIAFQLTNILRDIKEDASRGRIYLPLEDLARCGVAESDVLAGKDSPAFRGLVRLELERARKYYEASAELLPLVDEAGRPALAALVNIYRRLLDEIERRDYDVLSRRIALSKLEKVRLAGGLALKMWLKRAGPGPSIKA